MGVPRIFGGTMETTLIGWRNEPTRQKEVLLSWGPSIGEVPGHGRSTTGSAGGLADPPTRVLQIELGTRKSGEEGTQCFAVAAVECEWISDSVIAYDVFFCDTWEEQKTFGTSSMRGVLDGEKNPRYPLRMLGSL
ncbi:hypothetical protein NE237_008833 [Protea cynaroides]|uniref:Uncharacterized protein n=1 Tax=Protea cynaroides TaxID=273540 RepID=A0A9Q0KWA4_9MAGN|nr:hypothetical protein NE237_008833 [Protea cynaroides]